MQGVPVGTISEKQLSTLTTRLLAGASVLNLVGVGLVMRSVWEAAAVTFGSEGEATTGYPALAERLSIVLQDLSYRQVGLPLVVSSGLAAAAVATLHGHPSREGTRRLRWEVMVAGLLTLVVVVLFALVNLYVLAGPTTASDQPFGPSSPAELAAGNLTTLAASLLTLTAATLWWMRLTADEPDVERDSGDPEASEDEALDDQDVPAVESAEQEPSRHRASRVDDQSTPDYRRDWSPEDFLPPR